MESTDQRTCLLDGCDDWEVSADLPEWDSHPSIIKEARIRPDIVIHSSSTQQHYDGVNSSIQKQNGRGSHLQKREIPLPEREAKRCCLQSHGNAR